MLTRVIAAPIERAYAAFTSPSIGEWFGPHGYTCTTHEFDASVGGRWRYDMHGPAGERWPSRIEFLELVPNERIVYDHGDDVDDDPGRSPAPRSPSTRSPTARRCSRCGSCTRRPSSTPR
ncbi:MAG: SRPBCC domain-containing protein [Ilumatobacteraceae bacterium]